MVKFTPEQYAKLHEPHCPACGADSAALMYGSLNVEGPIVTQAVTCFDCGCDWYDVYRLEGYSELRARDHLNSPNGCDEGCEGCALEAPPE